MTTLTHSDIYAVYRHATYVRFGGEKYSKAEYAEAAHFLWFAPLDELQQLAEGMADAALGLAQINSDGAAASPVFETFEKLPAFVRATDAERKRALEIIGKVKTTIAGYFGDDYAAVHVPPEMRRH